MAPVTAASMLAMTWVALSSIRRPLILSPPAIAAFRDGCDRGPGENSPTTDPTWPAEPTGRLITKPPAARGAGQHPGCGRALELLSADVRLAVGDEPRQRLVQGVERPVPRRIAEHLPGPGGARGDAAEGVLAGGLGVLG